MATLRARRRSRTSRLIRFALRTDGFISVKAVSAGMSLTLDDQHRSVNHQVGGATFKLVLGRINILDS